MTATVHIVAVGPTGLRTTVTHDLRGHAIMLALSSRPQPAESPAPGATVPEPPEPLAPPESHASDAELEGMDHRRERIRIETERHRIVGELTLARDGYRSRVSDVLNAPERDFLTLTDVTVEPLAGRPGRAVPLPDARPAAHRVRGGCAGGGWVTAGRGRAPNRGPIRTSGRTLPIC